MASYKGHYRDLPQWHKDKINEYKRLRRHRLSPEARRRESFGPWDPSRRNCPRAQLTPEDIVARKISQKAKRALRYANLSKEEKDRLVQVAYKWRHKNPEKWRKAHKAYKKKQRTLKSLSWRAERARYKKKYYKSPVGRLQRNVRKRLKKALRKTNTKTMFTTNKLIGCSPSELRIWIEQHWTPGMSWDNYGKTDGWAVDHIIPVSSFTLSNPIHQLLVNNKYNLRPLNWYINSTRGDGDVVWARYFMYRVLSSLDNKNTGYTIE